MKRIERSEINLEREGHFALDVFTVASTKNNPITLKIEAAGYSETSVYLYWTAQRHAQQGAYFGPVLHSSFSTINYILLIVINIGLILLG